MPTVAYVLGVVWGWGRPKTRSPKVLKFIAPIDRKAVLDRALLLLGSRHQIQELDGRLIVEIGNSHLAESLVRNFGHPPGRTDRITPLPVLPFELIPHFARGLLQAAGQNGDEGIAWIGTPRAITTPGFIIRDATGVGHPRPRKVTGIRGSPGPTRQMSSNSSTGCTSENRQKPASDPHVAETSTVMTGWHKRGEPSLSTG